jgi:hypothetical protein
MENLARIISHGFAVVVVILLGIGFIYRGELFPDLELPDFLVPESGKTAGTGAHPEKIQPEVSAARKSAGGGQLEVMPSAPQPAPEKGTGITAHETGATPAAPEAAPPAGEVSQRAAVKAIPPAAENTATVTESTVGSPQASVEESRPRLVEQQPPTGGGRGVEAETAGSTAPASPPAALSSQEKAGEPSAEAPAPPIEMRGGSIPQEAPPESSQVPGRESAIPWESEPPRGAQTAGMGAEPVPAEAPPEETAPGTAAPVPESAPVMPPAVQPATGGAGHGAAGKAASQVKPYELLAAAREAFWLHNYDDAEKNYRDLTELEPNNPDGYGELGNMYFSQGRWDEAAEAYYKAGTRLVSEGRLDSARGLVNVIRGLNGKQADDLDKLIKSAASTSNN